MAGGFFCLIRKLDRAGIGLIAPSYVEEMDNSRQSDKTPIDHRVWNQGRGFLYFFKNVLDLCKQPVYNRCIIKGAKMNKEKLMVNYGNQQYAVTGWEYEVIPDEPNLLTEYGDSVSIIEDGKAINLNNELSECILNVPAFQDALHESFDKWDSANEAERALCEAESRIPE